MRGLAAVKFVLQIDRAMLLASNHFHVTFTFSRSERRRLEEQYEEVKNEVMELTSETEETTIQKLQDEIKECKAILKCGVCFDRPKEVNMMYCTAFVFSNGLNLFINQDGRDLHHSYLHKDPVLLAISWILNNQIIRCLS